MFSCVMGATMYPDGPYGRSLAGRMTAFCIWLHPPSQAVSSLHRGRPRLNEDKERTSLEHYVQIEHQRQSRFGD